jgi:hypothetical protein
MNWKDLEGKGNRQIDVLFPHLPGGTEKRQNTQSRQPVSPRAPPEYNSKALPLDQPVP